MSKLITKNGLTVRALASQLLLLDVGMRIPRVEDYSKQLEVGRGTVQTAMGFLQESGAIKLAACGHLGTVLVASDKKKLWTMAGLSNILGTMPLPYTKSYEGLATALCEVFAAADVPFGMTYQRGSLARIAAVKDKRSDFAVCSRLSAEYAVAGDDEITIAASLPPKTYVGEHAVIFRPGCGSQIVDGMSIAIDPSSIDQRLMTDMVSAGRKVRLVESPYNQTADMLRTGAVDAVVWNADEFEDKFIQLGCTLQRLDSREASTSTAATLVCRKSDGHLNTIIRDVVKSDKIIEIQAQVIRNEKLPRY